MSQDSYIYLPQKAFPDNAWREITHHFSATSLSINEWLICTDDGNIWLDLKTVEHTHIHSTSYCWEIGIHYSAPYGASKLWTALSVAYYCVTFLDDSVYHEPSGQIKIRDTDGIIEFSNSFIFKYCSLQKLAKLGVLDSQEKLTLD